MAALDDNREQNDGAAVNALSAFIHAVESQRGTKLTEGQADLLVSSARKIILLIGG